MTTHCVAHAVVVTRIDRRLRYARCVATIALDATDEAILAELQHDGRTAYREIARAVAVSEGTVRARVRRLRDAGVLQILAFVDPSRVGDSVLALVLARVDAVEHEAVAGTVAAWPEVTYVSSLIGRTDLYLQVIAADNRALWEVVGRLRALTGVRDTETSIEMQVHKFAYRDIGRRAGRRR